MLMLRVDWQVHTLTHTHTHSLLNYLNQGRKADFVMEEWSKLSLSLSLWLHPLSASHSSCSQLCRDRLNGGGGITCCDDLHTLAHITVVLCWKKKTQMDVAVKASGFQNIIISESKQGRQQGFKGRLSILRLSDWFLSWVMAGEQSPVIYRLLPRRRRRPTFFWRMSFTSARP